MTTSPDGEPVQVHNRLAEIHDRYGASHLVSCSIRRATRLILEAISQVNARSAGTVQTPQPRYGAARPSR